ALLPATMKESRGHALGRALERRYKTEKGKHGTQKPDACIEGESGKHDRAAPSDLQDGACTAPLLLGQSGNASHVARFFCDLQAIECRTAARSLFDTADIPCKIQQPAGALDLHGVAPDARRHRRLRKPRLPHHAAETACEFVAKATGLAR